MLEYFIEECAAQKNEGFVYDDFAAHMLRCIKQLTDASVDSKDNVQAIYYDKGKPKGAAVAIATVVAELLAVSSKYDLPIIRAFDIVLNKKMVKV